MKTTHFGPATFLALAIAAFLAGCNTTPSVTALTPLQAIEQAAASPAGVTGVFVLNVRNTGWDRGFAYLNSEEDYRDQRCLTIAISPAGVAAFRTKGIDPAILFKGHEIRVTGTARRTTVYFTSNGRRTDKYYYQTQVPVDSPDQITLKL